MKKKIKTEAELREWIKERLKERGISQNKFAQSLGYNPSSISKAIIGKNSKLLKRIITDLGGDLDNFTYLLPQSTPKTIYDEGSVGNG